MISIISCYGVSASYEILTIEVISLTVYQERLGNPPPHNDKVFIPVDWLFVSCQV